MRVSKLSTLTKRFLLFFRQSIHAHPSSPITTYYGNCQGKNNKDEVVLLECIPSPPSEASAIVFPLGITKPMVKKGLMKNRDRTFICYCYLFFSLLTTFKSLLYLNPMNR